MNKGKGALVLSKIAEKIQLIVGILIVIIFGLIAIMATFTDDFQLDMFIICYVITGLGIWMIILSRKRKKLISDFKLYVARLSMDPTGSIDNLALTLGLSQDEVKRNLMKMILKKYFVNAYIDTTTNCIVLPHDKAKNRNTYNTYNQNSSTYNLNNQNTNEVEDIAVTCKNCGGINKITKGKVGECEYCGSPINR